MAGAAFRGPGSQSGLELIIQLDNILFFSFGVGLTGLAVVPRGSDCPRDKFIPGCQLSSVQRVLTSGDLQPEEPQLTAKPCRLPAGQRLPTGPLSPAFLRISMV